MSMYITGITFHLPERVVTNADLAAEFPGWTEDKIEAKTGVHQRHIAAPEECASDLAVQAAKRLFKEHPLDSSSIDFLLFCTQSPDYPLPTTACLIHERLGLLATCGALDLSLGCSGFVYGLCLAQGLIASGQAKKVLLLNADTINQYIDPSDRGLRVLFGDGGAATLISAGDNDENGETDQWPFVFGTDGTGANNLIVKDGAARAPSVKAGHLPRLFMDGPEIFNFTLRVIPSLVNEVLAKKGMTKGMKRPKIGFSSVVSRVSGQMWNSANEAGGTTTNCAFSRVISANKSSRLGWV